MNLQFQNQFLGGQKMNCDELTLDYFVRNEANFNELTYIISFYDYVKKYDYRKNGDFLVYHGSMAILPHLIKGKRYFGNTKLIMCHPEEIENNKNYKRLIKVNEYSLFINSMLFIRASGKTYRLKDNEGFLQLDIQQRQHINII